MDKRKMTLGDAFVKTIEELRQNDKMGSAAVYSKTLNCIRRNGLSALQLRKVDSKHLMALQRKLVDKGLKRNTVAFYMRVIRTVYNHYSDSFIPAEKKPFSKVYTLNEKTAKRNISMQEMRKLKNVIPNNKNMKLAKDIMMFMFLCRGMTFVDVAYLQKNNIKDTIIEYNRHKTSQKLRIRINDNIMEIISRYVSSAGSYLFPIIKDQNRDIRIQYESGLRWFNRWLKKLAKLAGLSTNITSYTIRHTWATLAKQQGISVAVISDSLGHDSIRTTEIYLGECNSSDIDYANELVTRLIIGEEALLDKASVMETSTGYALA